MKPPADTAPAIVWAVHLGANTPMRLATEWGMPLTEAWERLQWAKECGLLKLRRGVYVVLSLLVLCITGCGEPRLLNPGAHMPVTAVDGPHMDRISGEYDRVGRYQRDGIYLLAGSELSSTFCHELAHMADDNGGDYAKAIRAITPPNPTPRFAERLRVAWEIAHTPGGYWHAIYQRWGEDAIQHSDIMAKARVYRGE
jgi:hypothetical protein